MNIISGIAKNIQLGTPKGLEVRPTSARARKSIFDSIPVWTGKTVVDLFSGSGALGLEAASRGAEKVFFSELSTLHCGFIEKNIEKVKEAGVPASLNLVTSDSTVFYQSYPGLSGNVDIIFADPPYKLTAEIMDKLFTDHEFAKWSKNATFILETSVKTSKKPTVMFAKFWRIKSIKTFGQSAFYFFESTIS